MVNFLSSISEMLLKIKFFCSLPFLYWQDVVTSSECAYFCLFFGQIYAVSITIRIVVSGSFLFLTVSPLPSLVSLFELKDVEMDIIKSLNLL